MAGYEDVNEADRLALDPVMRQVVGRRAVDAQAASSSQVGRLETETLALDENRAALADLSGQWIDRFHDRNGLKNVAVTGPMVRAILAAFERHRYAHNRDPDPN